MKSILIVVWTIVVIVLAMLFVKWVVNADMPLWLKIFLLK